MSTTLVDKQGGLQECVCPRCGSDAEWAFADEERTRVEVVCPDCGRYEMSKEEFDLKETDISEPDEQR